MGQALKREQAYRELRGRILSGELRSGDRLPGETVLAREMGISRVTLRSALERLDTGGLIERLDRKGTYVSREVRPRRFLVFTGGEDVVSNPFGYIIQGIRERLAEEEARLDACSLEVLRSLGRRGLEELIEGNSLEGLFLAAGGYGGAEPEVSLLRGCRIPVVLPHGAEGDQRFWDAPVLHPDFRRAFRDALEHLLACGHRRIGIILHVRGGTLVDRGMDSGECRDLVRSAGGAGAEALVVGAAYDAGDIRRAVGMLLDPPSPPTAVLCFSDFYAIHVYAALAERGRRIPEDVSVMGYCGYPDGRFMDPPLTSVDLDYRNIGRTAAETMLDWRSWFRRPGSPRDVVTPHRIVERKSILNVASGPDTAGKRGGNSK